MSLPPEFKRAVETGDYQGFRKAVESLRVRATTTNCDREIRALIAYAITSHDLALLAEALLLCHEPLSSEATLCLEKRFNAGFGLINGHNTRTAIAA
jgi:hypothetical protein